MLRLSEIDPYAASPIEIEKNWTLLAEQLDKVGITLDTDTREQISEGNQDDIDRVFLRIERYMKIIAGSNFFENLTVPENVFCLVALMSELD